MMNNTIVPEDATKFLRMMSDNPTDLKVLWRHRDRIVPRSAPALQFLSSRVQPLMRNFTAHYNITADPHVVDIILSRRSGAAR